MITSIYAHAVLHGTASFEEVPPTLEIMTERWLSRTRSGYPTFTALVDNSAVGYAYAGAYRSRPAYRHTVENSVYIAEFAHGRGVGKVLLTRLIDECQRLKFKQMIAVIGGKDHVASERLHMACDFRHVGVLTDVGFKLGAWQDTVLMQRAL